LWYNFVKIMKEKNIKLSLLILLGLIIISFAFLSVAQENSTTQNNIFLDSDQDGLSDAEEKVYGTDAQNPDTDRDGYSDGAEVNGGYNPLIPSPGDKLTENISKKTTPVDSSATTTATAAPDEENLTKKVAQKIADLNLENQDVSIAEITSLVQDSISTTLTDNDLPEINVKDIKIKKQNYDNLSAQSSKDKRQEDFSKYMAAVFYIFSSNSPEPITSTKDITATLTSTAEKIVFALSSRDASSLNDLQESGKKIKDQLMEVEVPEDLVELHIKALRFANYSISLKDYVTANSADPLSDIANLSKINAFVESLINFATEAENKITEYGFKYDKTFQENASTLGLPDLTPLLTPTEPSTSETATTTQ